MLSCPQCGAKLNSGANASHAIRTGKRGRFYTSSLNHSTSIPRQYAALFTDAA